MIQEHDMTCDCLDCQYAREIELDQLSVAVGLILGVGFALMLYTVLALALY